MANKSLTKNKAFKPLVVFGSLILIIMGVIFVMFATKDSKVVGGSGSQNEEEGTYTLSQLGHIKAEIERLKVNFGPSFYIPTGLYVDKHQKITISLNEHDQALQPRLVISEPIIHTSTNGSDDGIMLKPGKREYTAPEEGVIYLINHSNKSETPPVVTIEGANTIPTFKLGKTTIEEWEKSLEEHKDSPVFELISDKVFITADINQQDLVTDPEALLIKHNEAVDIEARVSGLDEDDPNPVHHPTKFRFHFRHGSGDFWMYATRNFTAYVEGALGRLMNIDTYTDNGWGPWHELGHLHQQTATTPSIFGEVTNDVFSLSVQREFGNPSRLEYDDIYTSAFAYLKTRADDYVGLHQSKLLASHWQLVLAYGEDVYPTIYRIVRETEQSELPVSDEERIQKFVYYTSSATKQNLIPFFERWGLTIDEDIKQDILDLGYPELAAPIWWNRDTNNTIKPFDVTLDSLSETLHAYKVELPEDVYEALDQHVTKAQDIEGKAKKVSEQIEEIRDLLNNEWDADNISEKMYEILMSQIDLLDV